MFYGKIQMSADAEKYFVAQNYFSFSSDVGFTFDVNTYK